MARSLVTGAGGFLGQQLCRTLKARGLHVRGLDSAAPAGLCDEFLHGDITQPLDPHWFEGVDTVFHLAGKVHALSEVAQDEPEYFRVNT